jgi:uncharacterized protein YfaS (alpha-2-macroglobulin family)
VDYTQRFVEVEQRALDLPGEAPGKIGFNVNWGPYRLEITDPATGLTTRFPFTAGWSYDDDNRGLDARPVKVKLACCWWRPISCCTASPSMPSPPAPR